jgi:hypothetical protein
MLTKLRNGFPLQPSRLIWHLGGQQRPGVIAMWTSETERVIRAIVSNISPQLVFQLHSVSGRWIQGLVGAEISQD